MIKDNKDNKEKISQKEEASKDIKENKEESVKILNDEDLDKVAGAGRAYY